MTLYLWAILVVTFVFKISNQCEYGEVRLVGGSGQHEGRVEVCINSQWGRVCSTSWDDNDATVVCRQLGYSPHDATTLGGDVFGQGSGRFVLGNVQCNPTRNLELLECCPDYTNTASCRNDASVRCSDQQRVGNVTAHILYASSTDTVYAVLVTWEQNLTVDQPISFEVVCRNEQHSIKITASNKNYNIQLEGLLPSSYNCCVSAVYQLYEAKEICTGVKTNVMSKTTTSAQSRGSNSVTIVGVLLGLIIIILLILLTLLMVWLLRPHLRKGIIPESVPTQQNVSYSSIAAVRKAQSTISGTLTQVSRSTREDESDIDCSNFGPVYETIDLRGGSNGRNSVSIIAGIQME